MTIRRHRHSQHELVRASDVNRISSLGQAQLMDEILRRLLVSNATHLPLISGKAAYFPGDCLVSHVSGDRSTGVQFNIGVGLGLKNFGSPPSPDSATVVPIHVAVAQAFTTSPSDATNPRIDRVFLRPKTVTGNPQTVFVIDPITFNITSTSLDKDTIDSFEHLYVPGTPAASPVAPAPPAGWTVDDLIATVTIAPGSGAFNPAGGNLADNRSQLEASSGLVPAITVFPASDVSVASPLVDSDAQAALERLTTSVSAAVPLGLRTGLFEYVNTSSVRIAEGFGGNVSVEIDGVVVSQPGPLVFAFPTHLDTGAEALSTFYYCYVRNSGGTLVPVISATAPQFADGTKVGYHPTIADARFVQAFYNDSQGNVAPFDEDATRAVYLRSTSSGSVGTRNFFKVQMPTDTEQPSIYASVSLVGKVPLGARVARLIAGMRGNDVVIYYGRASLVGVSINDFPTPVRIGDHNTGGNTSGQMSGLGFDLPMSNPSSPAFVWGTEIFGSTGANLADHAVVVSGWRF